MDLGIILCIATQQQVESPTGRELSLVVDWQNISVTTYSTFGERMAEFYWAASPLPEKRKSVLDFHVLRGRHSVAFLS